MKNGILNDFEIQRYKEIQDKYKEWQKICKELNPNWPNWCNVNVDEESFMLVVLDRAFYSIRKDIARDGKLLVKRHVPDTKGVSDYDSRKG